MHMEHMPCLRVLAKGFTGSRRTQVTEVNIKDEVSRRLHVCGRRECMHASARLHVHLSESERTHSSNGASGRESMPYSQLCLASVRLVVCQNQ